MESIQFFETSNHTSAPLTPEPEDSKLTLTLKAIKIGLILEVLGLLLLYIPDEKTVKHTPWWLAVCFFLASLFFIPAVFSLVKTYFLNVVSVINKLWVIVLGLSMFTFVPITLWTFGTYSIGLPSLAYVYWEIVDPSALMGINFTFLLGLQVITFALTLLSLYIANKWYLEKSLPLLSKKLFQGFLLMLLASLIGVACVFAFISNSGGLNFG